MTHTVTATEMARHFSEYMSRVSYGGERFFVARGSKVLAELRPVPQGRKLKDLASFFKSGPHLSRKEAADFADDVARARKEMNRRKVRDPWAS